MVEAYGVEYLPGLPAAYTEDFVYPLGYPGQFDMSGSVSVSSGPFTSDRPRDDFKVAQGIDTITDPGAYGGPGFDNDYYFMFPKMGWNEKAILSLSFLNNESDWTVYYDCSWTGHVDDEVFFLVNGIERERISSAGFPWRRMSYAGAPEGNCVLTWAVRTAAATTGVPEIARYLRITNLVITKGFTLASQLPTAVTSFAKLTPESSLDTTAVLVQNAAVSIVTDSSLRLSQVTMDVSIIGDSTVTVSNVEVDTKAECAMTTGSSVIVGNTTIGHYAISENGGFQVGTFGRLTVTETEPNVPLEAGRRTTHVPLNISGLVRPLVRKSLVMRPPIIINSRPMNPDFVGSAVINATASNIQLRNRITPDSVLHVYPSAQPTHRWISGEALSDAQGKLTDWPEHPVDNTLPVVRSTNTWTLKGPAYRPTVAPYRLPNNPTSGWSKYTEYPAVYFDSTRLTHLVADIPNSMTSQSGAGYGSTWFFVGVFNNRWSTIMDFANDSYTNGPFLDYNRQTYYNIGQNWNWYDSRWYDNAETKHSIGIGTGDYLYGTHTNSSLRKGKGYRDNYHDILPATRYHPAVFAVSYMGSKSLIARFGIGDLWWLTERNGYDYYVSTPRQQIALADVRSKYMLGKAGAWNIPGHSSATGTFMLSEVAMYNSALPAIDILTICSYLISVYGFLTPGMTEVPDQ